MNFYRDEKTGEVFVYDDEQMAVINRINQPDFDREKEGIPDVFFEIDRDIKRMHKMTAEEIEAHINPPVTKERQIADAEETKQRLISEVTTETAMLRAKLALKRIKPDEEALLIAWLDYLDELEAVDVSTAPDIIWPVKPEV